MIYSKFIAVYALFGATVVAASPNMENACGKLNVIFTGLPPYHPLVTEQGFDPVAVDAALRKDAANIIRAGYNLRVILIGPETDIAILGNQTRGIQWAATGIGYGVRGSNREDLTLRLVEIIKLYRERVPYADILFDFSPNSSLWAIQQEHPLPTNCSGSPGADLGFEIFCEICTESLIATD